MGWDGSEQPEYKCWLHPLGRLLNLPGFVAFVLWVGLIMGPPSEGGINGNIHLMYHLAHIQSSVLVI